MTPQHLPRMSRYKERYARCTIDRKTYHLGAWGSKEAEANYRSLLATYISDGRPAKPNNPTTTVDSLIAHFVAAHEDKYSKDEMCCYRSVLRPTRELFRQLPVEQFGPLKLLAVRQRCTENGWCRNYINKSMNRLRRVFRWGVSRELVPLAVFQALQTVGPLRYGEALDHPPRRPAPIRDVELVKTTAPQRVCDLIDLQLLTGARAGELLSLTTEHIVKDNDVWIAPLEHHKMAHLEKQRVLLFGPKGKLILAKWLNYDDPSQPIFGGYHRHSYWCAIKRHCMKHGIPRWTPHQLRHTRATQLRDAFDLEVAADVLGHSDSRTTMRYSNTALMRAMAAIREVG